MILNATVPLYSTVFVGGFIIWCEFYVYLINWDTLATNVVILDYKEVVSYKVIMYT